MKKCNNIFKLIPIVHGGCTGRGGAIQPCGGGGHEKFRSRIVTDGEEGSKGLCRGLIKFAFSNPIPARWTPLKRYALFIMFPIIIVITLPSSSSSFLRAIGFAMPFDHTSYPRPLYVLNSPARSRNNSNTPRATSQPRLRPYLTSNFFHPSKNYLNCQLGDITVDPDHTVHRIMGLDRSAYNINSKHCIGRYYWKSFPGRVFIIRRRLKKKKTYPTNC